MRWIALLLLALGMFCAYIFMDILSPIKDLMESTRGWDSKAFGTMEGAETFLNVFVFFLIFAGIILDKMGVRFTAVLSGAVMLIGGLIKYYAISPSFVDSSLAQWFTDNLNYIPLFDELGVSPFYRGMPASAKVAAIGFMIFGCGAEMAGITVSRGIVKWFKGRETALAMGSEMALARLYETTGEKRYLDLASHFIDARGQRPLLFEPRIRKKGFDPFTASYHQAHQPVREQKEAVGHAVRAVYLYSGMADVARLTGDETLLKACRNIWDSITQTKLYVTGGIGGTYLGESFSYPYDLPADSAYSETCAAIGLVFFARRMLQLDPDAKYGDVMELALYNTVLAGKAMDGKSFFYVNPLEADPATLPLDGRLEHVVVPRQKWFGCACCPPNIARTLSSVQSYAYTASADTLFVHLYLDSEVNVDLGGRALSLATSTAYPWDGAVRLCVRGGAAAEATIALRIPGWCRNHSVKILDADGNSAEDRFTKRYDRGYLYLTGQFVDETIELSLDLAVRLLAANNAVKEARGMAALARGPITYCLEEADNGKDLHLLFLNVEAIRTQGIQTKTISIGDQEVTALEVPGFREPSERGGPLYRDLLYSAVGEAPAEIKRDEALLTFVPYYAWDNRGSGEMRVYVPLL